MAVQKLLLKHVFMLVLQDLGVPEDQILPFAAFQLSTGIHQEGLRKERLLIFVAIEKRSIHPCWESFKSALLKHQKCTLLRSSALTYCFSTSRP